MRVPFASESRITDSLLSPIFLAQFLLFWTFATDLFVLTTEHTEHLHWLLNQNHCLPICVTHPTKNARAQHIHWNPSPSHLFHHQLRSRSSCISARRAPRRCQYYERTQRRDNRFGEAVGPRVREAWRGVFQDAGKADRLVGNTFVVNLDAVPSIVNIESGSVDGTMLPTADARYFGAGEYLLEELSSADG